MFGLSKGCRTCCRKQQNKIQPASRKSKREFFRRENTKCTFSSRRHLCFRLGRQAAQSPTLPDRQHILFRRQPAQISRLHSAAAAANPSIVKCFLQLRFSRRENTRYIFFQHPKPSLPAWPANIYRCQSYYNLQQDNSFPSGASRPTSPAALLLIPAHNPQQANSLPPGLAGRRLIFLLTTFLTSTKHHLPTKYRSLPFFHTSSFFYFLYRRHPPGFRLSVPPTPISSHHFPNSLHFFRPAAAFPNSSPNAKRSFARGCSLQGCRVARRPVDVGFATTGAERRPGEEPAFLLFSLCFFFLLLSFLSPFPSPWRRGFAATPSFFFLLLFFFLFFLFVFLSFYFCSYLCFFLFIFSLYFSSCFFLFVFSFFYFYFSFYFLFLFYFYFLFLLSFCFYFYLCLLYFFSLFFFLVFIFASPFLFFVFLFVLLFYPPYSNLFPHYPTARQPFIFFSSAANLSHSLQPLLGSSKKKKISAKESTGVEWPPGSERAAE